MIFFLLNVLTCLVCAAPISLKDGIPIRQVSVRPANLTSIQYDKWKLDQAKDAAKFNEANISSSKFLSKKNGLLKKHQSCVNNAGWYDSYDDGCEWYEENGCDAAHIFKNDEGIDAKSACCACGGGVPGCQRDTMDGIQFGDRFVQFGDWRFGDVDGNHASIAHKDGKTAQIYRSDGTVHPGPRNDFSTWHRAIGTPMGVSLGDRFIQVGEWRLGAVDSNHASISHKDDKTAQIFRSDGTLHPGPRNPLNAFSTWHRAVGDPTGISWGTKFLQLGKFRIGDIGGYHASIAHKDGKTAQIYRSDGTLHPGPRNDWTTWDRDIKCQENGKTLGENLCQGLSDISSECELFLHRDGNYCNIQENSHLCERSCCSEDLMIADTTKNNFKCGNPGSSSRLFDLRNERATEDLCKQSCTIDPLCVAFSGEFNGWCIGCSKSLDTEHPGAIAFKKPE